MPFALAVIGILLVVTGARGTYGDLKNLLIGDFTGDHNFMYWVLAIVIVGFLGYVPQLETFSRVFLGLVIIAMLIAKRGFANKFMAALKELGSASGADTPPAAPVERNAQGQPIQELGGLSGNGFDNLGNVQKFLDGSLTTRQLFGIDAIPGEGDSTR